MKVIVDVNLLYEEIDKRGAFDAKAYITGSIAQIIAGQYPEWAEKKTTARLSKMEGGYTHDFEMFWSNYTKKVNKGTAFIEWKKIKDEKLLEKVTIALDWQKPLWAKDNNKYVPNPENYLKGRRWEDEPQSVATKEKYQDMNGNWRER